MRVIQKIFSAFLISLFTLNISWAGAWGAGSFQNDSALDWAQEEITPLKSSKVLIFAFNQLPKSGYIQVDMCSEVVAAAEIVASMKDGNMDNLPKEVAIWAKRNENAFSNHLASQAIEAIEICSNKKRSELAQLWDDSSNNEWITVILAIKNRLK